MVFELNGATLDEATTQLDLIELSGDNAEFCRTGACSGVPR